MPLLGQASGGWTESSSALRILNLGISNSVGVCTDDAFTQTNPPILTGATATAQVDTSLTGVLSGSVCFSRPATAGGGSNQIGGPVLVGGVVAGANVRPLGVFVNSANGNSFENTPATASGKCPYVSAMGTFGNTLFEDKVLVVDGALGAAGVALPAYDTGMVLFASRNGYLTHFTGGTTANQSYEGATPVTVGVVKMPPDSTQGDLVYDQRI